MGTPPDDDMTNERFRLLVKRSVLLDDVEATLELERYLLSKIWPKIRAFRGQHGSSTEAELVDALIDKAHYAARRTIDKSVDKPRDYVMRAVTNAFLDEVRRIDREQARTIRDDVLASRVQPASLQSDEYEDLATIAALKELRGRVRDGVGERVVQVVMLVYMLNVADTEACRLMDFGPTEQETVLRTLRRWRAKPDFELHRGFNEGVEGGLDD